MNQIQPLMEAGDAMARRLLLLRDLAAGAADCGDATLELHLAEVWEPGDAAAVAGWEAAKAQSLGQVPLFPETLAPAAQRDLLGDFRDLTPKAREAKFNRAMNRLAKATGGGSPMDDSAWIALWDQDQERAMEFLNFAVDHRRPASSAIPTAMEVAAWKGGNQ